MRTKLPLCLLYGREARFHKNIDTKVKWSSEFTRKLDLMWKKAAQSISKVNDKRKTLYDKKYKTMECKANEKVTLNSPSTFLFNHETHCYSICILTIGIYIRAINSFLKMTHSNMIFEIRKKRKEYFKIKIEK
jgi:hypothetical protein